jgi:hypothetical protein
MVTNSLLVHLQQAVDCNLLVSSAGLEYRSNHLFVHVREHILNLGNEKYSSINIS